MMVNWNTESVEVVDQLMQQIQQVVRQQLIQQSEVVGLQVLMQRGSWREIELRLAKDA
jgi:hypothetical protein